MEFGYISVDYVNKTPIKQSLIYSMKMATRYCAKIILTLCFIGLGSSCSPEQPSFSKECFRRCRTVGKSGRPVCKTASALYDMDKYCWKTGPSSTYNLPNECKVEVESKPEVESKLEVDDNDLDYYTGGTTDDYHMSLCGSIELQKWLCYGRPEGKLTQTCNEDCNHYDPAKKYDESTGWNCDEKMCFYGTDYSMTTDYFHVDPTDSY